MKKITIALGLLFTLFLSASGAGAQTAAAKTVKTVTLAPDISKLPIDKLLQAVQTAQTANTDSADDDASPLQVIAAFLQLQPAQITELETLLQARQAALVPLVQQIEVLGQQVDTLLNSGGNPAQIGMLVLQIHARQMQVAQTQLAFLGQFIALLSPDQLQRVQALQVAVAVQPVLPAFRLIFLF